MVSSYVLSQVVLSSSSEFAALESAAEFCVAYLMFAFDVSIKVCPQTKSFCTGWALEWLCVCLQMLAVGVFNNHLRPCICGETYLYSLRATNTLEQSWH
jgi:hypothetical protein